MTTLLGKPCTPCEKEAPPLSGEQARMMLLDLPHWRVETPGGEAPRLVRLFEFSGFHKAVDFTQELADRADEANHHPTVILQLENKGSATVFWWTHHKGALNRNDFIMAAETDKIYEKGRWRRTTPPRESV